MPEQRFSAEQLANHSVKRVTLPDVYLRLKTVLETPNASLDDVSRVIAGDTAIVARLLKFANSSFFGFQSRVETISRAVTLLGSQMIHDLVLATSVAEAFSSDPEEVVTMENFWVSSSRCGVLARQLAMACDVLDNERLFVEGLLLDIGHLPMYQALPKACRRARAMASVKDLPLDHCERELIGCSYVEVGAELMQRWKFPPALIAALRYQNNPAEALDYPLEAAIVHIASRLKTVELSGADAPPELDNVDPVAWQRTGLSAAAMGPLLDAAGAQLKTTIQLLFPHLSRSA